MMECHARTFSRSGLIAFLVGVSCVVAATAVGHWLVLAGRPELRSRLNRLDGDGQWFDVFYDHETSLSPLPGRCQLMLGLGAVGIALLLFGAPRRAGTIGGEASSNLESIRRAERITLWGGAACFLAATALGLNLSGDARNIIAVPWLRLDLMFSDDIVANDTYVRQARSWFFSAAALTWVALGFGSALVVRGLRSRGPSRAIAGCEERDEGEKP